MVTVAARKPRSKQRDRSEQFPSRAVIIRIVDEVYRGPAWHGPSVRAVLRELTPDVASHRIAPGRNTPWELLLHLAYTRHRLLVRLGGAAAGKFPRKLGRSWWPEAPAKPTEAHWAKDVALLEEYQRKLIDEIETTSLKNLRRIRSGKTSTIADELLGLAAHDAYHSGQIRLMARLSRK
jgi:uncharacterized damage-inducible protein DinB